LSEINVGPFDNAPVRQPLRADAPVEVSGAVWDRHSQSTINVGSLVLDMYDPTTKQLVWPGTATNKIDPSSNQEKNQKNLNKAMQKVLKYYPAK